ncbi:hypothetical protein GCK32_003428 [Trichostrongylus colubriformis]|uniref:RRM domain-containing protein n=1 Tax=Trichostrongylus colubriformis TaxID=6319 RepID=A0AAN8FJP1_TRICO
MLKVKSCREKMGDMEDSIKLDDDDLLSTTGNSVADMAELSSIEQQMEEFEEEQRKIKQMQSDIEGQMNLPRSSNGNSSPAVMTPEEKAEADSRSVYIGNVDYSVTAEELEKHFHGCGSVARVTILCDKYTGHPKGFAYAEFADKEGMQMALAMSDSLLKGRQIKVMEKRTNRPGISTTNRPPRGRGYRGRGGFGGAPPGYIIKYVPVGGYRPRGARGLRRPRGFLPYTILHIGCGTSQMSMQLFEMGFRNITNVDFSQVLVDAGRVAHPEMEWICDDIRSLGKIPSSSFDVVLEKATLEALLVKEKSTWSPSDHALKTVDDVLSSVARVLTNNGVFISISFTQPHFRVPALLRFPEWSISVNEFGDYFHYFVFIMQRGEKASQETYDRFARIAPEWSRSLAVTE